MESTALAHETMRDDADASTAAGAFRAIYRTLLARDANALDALLDADFTLTHITGYRQPRAEWLAEIAAGRMQYHAAREVSLQSSVVQESARVVGRHVVDATIWGARGTWNLELTTDFARRGSGWTATRTLAAIFR